MITAMVGPTEFDNFNGISDFIAKDYTILGVVCFVDVSKEGKDVFASLIRRVCEETRTSYLQFFAHWDTGDDAYKSAIANLATVADRLVAFMSPGDLMCVYTIAQFKKAHKPVQVVQVGKRKSM